MSAQCWRVLVVDDSPATRRMIRRVLEACDFPIGEVIEAGDGYEALSRLASTSVDVILTDINMPNMNGEQLVEELNRDPGVKRPPVIVISTDSTLAREHRMLDLGAKGYVTKPFYPEKLSAELTRVLCPPAGVE